MMHGRTLLYCVSSAATRRKRAITWIAIGVAACALQASADVKPSLFPLATNWTVEIGGPPVANAPPLSDASRIYIALRSGSIVARSASDGSEVWNRPLATDRAIALDNGLLFAVSSKAVYALRGTDGSTAWTRPMPIPSAPLLARGGWLITAADTTVTARRGQDGSVVWTRDVGVVSRRPAVDGNRLYVPTDDGRIVALNLEDGSPVWEREVGGVPAEPVAAADRVYVGASDRQFYSLKAADGEVDWTWRVGANMIGAPAVDDQRVYFVALDNVVRALDRESGVLKWQHAIRRRAASGPSVVQDAVLLASSSSGEIYAWLATGHAAGTILLESPPVVPPDLAGGEETGARLSVVTGSLSGVWRLALIAAVREPPPVPLTELPGRPLEISK
jgi:outer membrane protein assembly factor BamB